MANGSDDSVNIVTIKVLLFFEHASDTLFANMEAKFNIKIITTSFTKFYCCISALPSKVSAQLTHLIQYPGKDPYQDIKDCLIDLYSLSNYQKFEALINLPFTRDTMPSILMNAMLNLYPKKFKTVLIFIGLFLRSLPSPSKTISKPCTWKRTPMR